jgi:hypothetical protein
LVVVWSCNFVDKEVVCLKAMSYSKFIQGAYVLAVGQICVAAVKFSKPQQVEFMSNLSWKPWRGVENLK